ncbi:TonB-dependent receptor [Paraflavisolibacter sp. H34]|uniref:SusC/RagA family TonB-linked outer membrane protein n=1 Tax=Huijunlia imazamoxiresistens TaxID=3127457 RepID=UPI00301B286E
MKLVPYSFLFLACSLQVGGALASPAYRSLATSRFFTGREIGGRVIDEATGSPLAGASVQVKDGGGGVSTDEQGRFSLSLPPGATTLVISSVGYTPQEVKVGATSSLVIALRAEGGNLQSVVVVGYGKQKKATLTGSVATVDQKALANRPITNATQALQGVPGLYVGQAKGRPGAENATIRVRGVGTLNNSDPLVLVDGVEFPLGDINPNDIESITILKDAASSAIYGNRAANGVVLVKTKSGARGRFRLDYNFYAGSQQVTGLPAMVTNSVQYMEGKNRALANEGKPAEYSQALIDEYKGGTDPYIYPNTNWFDVLFRKAPISEHNLRLSGGTDKTTFSVSLGYLNQDGIMINTGAKKYTLNASVTSDLTQGIRIGANLLGTWWNSRESAYTADEGNGEGGLMGLTYRGLPMQVPYAQDGTYADQWVRVPGHNFFRNPLALSYEGFRKNDAYRTLANLFAEVQLPAGIRYKITGAANLLASWEKFNYPQINLTHPKTGAVAPMGNIPARGVAQSNQQAVNLTNFHTLSWEKRLARHQLSALGGFSVEAFRNSNFNAANQGYLGNDLTELNAGTNTPQVGGTSSQSRLQSYFGRLNYDFSGKYLFEASFRYDGSSRFAQGHRWGFFPSLSGGWRLSEEAFLKGNPTLSNLKLRASWGRLGNQSIGLYSYVDGVSIGQDYGYSFNGTVVSGAAITQLSDPGITWETTAMTDAGLDVGLFRNKLTAELDFFSKNTTNILRQITVPAQVGNLRGPYQNIGAVVNRGVDATLQYKDRFGPVGVQAAAGLTYVKNKVTNLNGQIYYDGQTITREGYPIASFFGLQAEGIFQSTDEIAKHAFQNAVTKPGDLKYRDTDGNGLIDNNDRVVIGNSIPGYTYSFNVGASWRGFELTAFLQGVQEADTYLNGNLAQPYRNGAGITPDWLTGSWTPENPGARLPRLTTGNGYPQNFQTSSFWIQDASYLRLKNLQLSYSVPETWTKKVRISGLKLFANAQNYVTFTKFKLSDPERNLTKTNPIDYPNYKSVTAGFNLSL